MPAIGAEDTPTVAEVAQLSARRTAAERPLLRHCADAYLRSPSARSSVFRGERGRRLAGIRASSLPGASGTGCCGRAAPDRRAGARLAQVLRTRRIAGSEP